MPSFDLSRRLAAEALGTAFLVATVVGSGIMAESLTKDVALALLGNTLPTGAMLVVLITILGPISGAHFNPAVSIVFALKRELAAAEARCYIVAQIIGGIAGTVMRACDVRFAAIDASLKVRTGGAQWFAEGVAAFGLVVTILAGPSSRVRPFPGWSASTSPPPIGSRLPRRSQIQRLRSRARLTNTFSGIRPLDLPGFIAAATCGRARGLWLMNWLLRPAANRRHLESRARA